jgi:hypothetical protein
MSSATMMREDHADDVLSCWLAPKKVSRASSAYLFFGVAAGVNHVSPFVTPPLPASVRPCEQGDEGKAR